MTQASYKCPRCGSMDVGRSHRRILEKLLFGFRSFRCHTCLRRFRKYLNRSQRRELDRSAQTLPEAAGQASQAQ